MNASQNYHLDLLAAFQAKNTDSHIQNMLDIQINQNTK